MENVEAFLAVIIAIAVVLFLKQIINFMIQLVLSLLILALPGLIAATIVSYTFDTSSKGVLIPAFVLGEVFGLMVKWPLKGAASIWGR